MVILMLYGDINVIWILMLYGELMLYGDINVIW